MQIKLDACRRRIMSSAFARGCRLSPLLFSLFALNTCHLLLLFIIIIFFVMHWSLKLGQSRREHKAKSLRIIKRRWQQQQTSSPLLCSLTLSADDPLARTTNNLYIHNYIHTYLHILVCTILLRNGCRSAYLTDLIIISEPSGSLPPARSSATRQVKIERKKWKLRSLNRK